MNYSKNKFATLVLLACVWFCCCCMSCDPMDGYWVGYVKAYKPADVDSLQMCVYSNDSLIATEYSFSTEYEAVARYYYDDYCQGDEFAGKDCKLTVAITFFCGDKKVDLPEFKFKTKINSHGYSDHVKYCIIEFDERKISGDYTIETFLAPEDTSCGKFVNYAVLKVEED